MLQRKRKELDKQQSKRILPVLLRGLVQKRHANHSNLQVANTTIRLWKGNYEQAETLYRRALTICEQILGFKHPTTKLIRDNFTIFRQQLH